LQGKKTFSEAHNYALELEAADTAAGILTSIHIQQPG
jgi:hypothetical protein